MQNKKFYTTLFWNIFICIFILLSAKNATAQIKNTNVKFSNDTALIGDYLNLNIEVTYNQGDVYFPILKDSLGNGFEVISKESEKISDTLNMKKKSINYTLIQFDEGIYNFEPLSFLYKNNLGQVDTFYSNSFSINIKTVVVDTLQEIKPIKSIYFPPHEFKEFIPIIIGSILLISLLVLGIYLWKKYNKKEPIKVILTPEDIYNKTIQDLEKLKLERLWTSDQVKEHHLKLSEILRTYLEYRFEILALESTTHEIEMALSEKKSLNNDAMKNVLEVLAHCDLVKFAKWKPDEVSSETIMNQSIVFVKNTKPVFIKKDIEIK